MIEEIRFNNLGTVNKNEIRIETNHGIFYLTFSYQTLVGIQYPKGKAVIENLWSTTTGKLLNELEPDKKKRLELTAFGKEVDKMFKEMNKK